jgi:hypothetical protein
MLKIFEKFRKPVTADELKMMRICDIVNSSRCLLDKHVSPYPEHNICIVKDVFEELLHEKLGPDVTVWVNGIVLGVRDDTFNAGVREFITENKLVYPESWACTIFSPVAWNGGYHDAIIDKLTFPEQMNGGYHDAIIVKLAFLEQISGCSDDRISGEVSGTVRLYERKKNAFEALKKFMEDKRWLVQCVNRIHLSSVEDNDYNIEWSISDLEITPELLDGFISTVKMVVTAGLTDEEAGAWRQHIIEKFRTHAYGNITSVDFDKPSATIGTPEKWKKDYHEKYKPEQERRERCAGVLEEIRGKIDIADILNCLERNKRQLLLQQLVELNHELP